LIGSANMTSGGLHSNHEFSAVVSGPKLAWRGELDGWIKAQVKDAEIVEANNAHINQYAARRKVYLSIMQATEKRAAIALNQPPNALATLRADLEAMKAIQGGEGFAAQVAQRAANLPLAQGVLRKMAKAAPMTRDSFLEHYSKLVGGVPQGGNRLWHSGGLHRAKSVIANHAPAFRKALRTFNANPSDDPATLFNQLKASLHLVPRAGLNVITEILHTRDKTRFPVMNQNSVAGMRTAGFTTYPLQPNRANVTGEIYAAFCADAHSVRCGLGLNNFSELDAVFNFAYWD
jgi:hypothetical protein